MLLWFSFPVSQGWCLNQISTHTEHMLVFPQLIIHGNGDNHEQLFKECLSPAFHVRVTSFIVSRGTGEAQIQLRHPQMSLAGLYVAADDKVQRAQSGNVLFCPQIQPVLPVTIILHFALRERSISSLP